MDKIISIVFGYSMVKPLLPSILKIIIDVKFIMLSVFARFQQKFQECEMLTLRDLFLPNKYT